MTNVIDPELFNTLMRNVHHTIDVHEQMCKETVTPQLVHHINYAIKSAIKTVISYVKQFLPEDVEETTTFLKNLHMALYDPAAERRRYNDFDHIYQVFWNRGSKTYLDALDDIWFVGILFNVFSNHDYQKTAEIVEYYVNLQFHMDCTIKNQDYLNYLDEVAFSCLQ